MSEKCQDCERLEQENAKLRKFNSGYKDDIHVLRKRVESMNREMEVLRAGVDPEEKISKLAEDLESERKEVNRLFKAKEDAMDMYSLLRGELQQALIFLRELISTDHPDEVIEPEWLSKVGEFVDQMDTMQFLPCCLSCGDPTPKKYMSGDLCMPCRIRSSAEVCIEDIEKNCQHGFEVEKGWDWAESYGTKEDHARIYKSGNWFILKFGDDPPSDENAVECTKSEDFAITCTMVLDRPWRPSIVEFGDEWFSVTPHETSVDVPIFAESVYQGSSWDRIPFAFCWVDSSETRLFQQKEFQEEIACRDSMINELNDACDERSKGIYNLETMVESLVNSLGECKRGLDLCKTDLEVERQKRNAEIKWNATVSEQKERLEKLRSLLRDILSEFWRSSCFASGRQVWISNEIADRVKEEVR